MKKIIINILLYIIFCELVFIGMFKAFECLEKSPTMQYQQALDEGLTWSEYIEKNK